MKLLLFVGAGGSVELGVPAMRDMVLQFWSHLQERGLSQEILAILDNRIKDGNYDIENLIEELDQLAQGYVAQEKWGDRVEGSLAKHVSVVRPEAEWFVQHVCEGVKSNDACQLWLPTLRVVSPNKVTIATTNYDRAIELAAAKLPLRLADGFDDFGEKEWAKWKGFDESDGINLLKLHGSTDWYHSTETDAIWKLRHAMPLFGSVTLSLDRPEGLNLKSAVVLPSREKKVTQVPYPDLAYQFRKAAKEVEVAVFLGTSLRDPDIRSLCNQCAERIPTFIVSRSASSNTEHLSHSMVIVKQSASRFLMSTLPVALRLSDTNEFVERMKLSPEAIEPVFEWMKIASDTNRPLSARLETIDKLAAAKVALDKENVETLLTGEETDVRAYALALIQDSPDQDHLVALAQKRCQEGEHPSFKRETETLLKLLGREV